jgi:hypothetical protein
MRRWILPESIEDILPFEARRLERLRRALLDEFSLHGYELVMPPLHRVPRVAAHRQRAMTWICAPSSWSISSPAMAKNVVVVGTQWGDEGKGKIVDWLTDHAKGVVRFQGGHNAGHTLVIGGRRQAAPGALGHRARGRGLLHRQRRGARRPTCCSEIDELEAGGVEVRDRLRVSSRACPLILPYHAALDRAREAAKAGGGKIGTTGKRHRPGLRGQGRAAARCACATCSTASASPPS